MATAPPVRKFVNPNAYAVHLPSEKGNLLMVFPWEEDKRKRKADALYIVEGDYWQRFANTGQLRTFRDPADAVAPKAVAPAAPTAPNPPAPAATPSGDDDSGDAGDDSAPPGSGAPAPGGSVANPDPAPGAQKSPVKPGAKPAAKPPAKS